MKALVCLALAAAPLASGDDVFRDVARETGLDFRHFLGGTGDFYLAEVMGPGAALFDYDGDGDLDAYLLSATTPNRLFRNDGGRFVDVTAAAHVAGGADQWSTSAGFFDYDGDGRLDLFVCNYVVWSRETDLELGFTLDGTTRAYGPPTLYRGTDCTLYRNDGDGSFADVTVPAGIAVRNPATGQPMGKALAVTFVDVDADGWMDVLVANDTVQNFLFRNRGNGTFVEVGTRSGVAYSGEGTATGAMGMDVGDYANGGGLAVGIGNFAKESTSFYVQQPDPWQFADMSASEGIGSPSRLRLSFGLFFFDYDLDGRLDLLQANGHLEDEINAIERSQTYEQAAQLFWNRGTGAGSCFVAVPEETTGDLARPIVGRGATYADIDADGDLDVLLTQVGRAPLLLRNDQALGHHWLRVLVRGAGGNRDAIGAWVEVETPDGVVQRRQVMPARSYLSSVERTLTFGLGANDRVAALRVRWPDGTRREIAAPPIDAQLEVAPDDAG